jgi:protein-S-isoprenylcysteine O-methyltransferase Ste14
VVQFMILLIWLAMLQLGDRLVIDNTTVRWMLQGAGVAIAAAGLLMVTIGGYYLGRNLTPLPEPRTELATDGIYRRVRHPMYGGTMLVLVGVTITFLSPLAAIGVVIAALFFHAKAQYEESLLRRKFPGYDGYARDTFRFIPGLW